MPESMPEPMFEKAVDHLHTLSEVYFNLAIESEVAFSVNKGEILTKLESRILSILNALPEGQI